MVKLGWAAKNLCPSFLSARQAMTFTLLVAQLFAQKSMPAKCWGGLLLWSDGTKPTDAQPAHLWLSFVKRNMSWCWYSWSQRLCWLLGSNSQNSKLFGTCNQQLKLARNKTQLLVRCAPRLGRGQHKALQQCWQSVLWALLNFKMGCFGDCGGTFTSKLDTSSSQLLPTFSTSKCRNKQTKKNNNPPTPSSHTSYLLQTNKMCVVTTREGVQGSFST